MIKLGVKGSRQVGDKKSERSKNEDRKGLQGYKDEREE